MKFASIAQDFSIGPLVDTAGVADDKNFEIGNFIASLNSAIQFTVTTEKTEYLYIVCSASDQQTVIDFLKEGNISTTGIFFGDISFFCSTSPEIASMMITTIQEGSSDYSPSDAEVIVKFLKLPTQVVPDSFSILESEETTIYDINNNPIAGTCIVAKTTKEECDKFVQANNGIWFSDGFTTWSFVE